MRNTLHEIRGKVEVLTRTGGMIDKPLRREADVNRGAHFVPRSRKRIGVRKSNQQIAAYARRRRLNCISIREEGENAAEAVICGFDFRTKCVPQI